MTGRFLSVAAVALALVALAHVLAGTVSADQPSQVPKDPPRVKPSTERTLRLPETLYNYADPKLPAHFKTQAARRFDNTPADNPVTDAGATLGRVIFHDTRLSASNTVACASCHLQKNAFANPERFSKGHEGKRTDRHAPGLANVRYYARGRFFWDERAKTLEDQILMPIQSKVEMGQNLPGVVDVLSKDEHYAQLFTKAFGDSKITKERLAKAVAQFVRSMVSCRSKYDEGLAKVDSVRDDFPNYTAQENRGKTLFVQRCGTCHLPGGQSAHFFMDRPLNNGLDADIIKTDGGVGDITLNRTQVGLFKSPSLRNVELTGPYMHDGRFATLDDVIDHYSKGIKNHPNLDGRARRAQGLDSTQKAALIAFLKTLTDNEFTTDPKFADPFE
jgi:cytochrome c peroxidase